MSVQTNRMEKNLNFILFYSLFCENRILFWLRGGSAWLISPLGSRRAAFPFIRNAVSRHLMNVCPIFLAVWLLRTAEITISASPQAKRSTIISGAALVASRRSFGAEQENSSGLLEPFSSSEHGRPLCLKNKAERVGSRRSQLPQTPPVTAHDGGANSWVRFPRIPSIKASQSCLRHGKIVFLLVETG